MNRRALLALLAAGTVIGTRFALARSPDATHRLGVLLPYKRDEWMKDKEGGPALLKALADLGYVEGRNLKIEWRFCEMDHSRSAPMAAELVRLGVDVLWTMGTSQTRALQAATKTIPIIAGVGDPVTSGVAKILARPEGNITGLAFRHPDTPAKQVDLIRRIVPKLDRLVFIYDVRDSGKRDLLSSYEVAARAAGLTMEIRLVDATGFERVFMEMKGHRARAAFIEFPLDELPTLATEVAKLAIRYGVATMFYDTGYVEAGGLMNFSMIHGDLMQRFATMIDKVFKGMKPADIPWELPDRSHLALNLRTARLLGLTVPADLLLRTDQVVQ